MPIDLQSIEAVLPRLGQTVASHEPGLLPPSSCRDRSGMVDNNAPPIPGVLLSAPGPTAADAAPAAGDLREVHRRCSLERAV